MRFLSLCSGIEAASVAWRPLGWAPVAFAEIEPFPCAVLAHHFPTVPNLGDITKIDGTRYRGAVDLIVAGTPCQDFSIAGKRAGMDGERSGLAREFIRLVREINPQWILWENVPGVFSTNGGRDFGTFVKSLDDGGYRCAWRVLDAQFFGVPQRRRRVFLVGYFGDWRPAAKVLFERESLRRNFKACRKERQEVVGTIKGGSGRRGWQLGAEEAASGQLQISHWDGGPHPTLNHCSANSGGIGMSNQELFSQKGAGLVPANESLAIRTAQTSANGHGISQEISHTLDAANGQAITYAPPIVEQAISCKWAKGTSGPAGDEHHNLIVAPLTSKPYSDNAAQESKLVVQPNNIAGTLCASGAGMERVAGQANEPGLLVLATQQGGAEIGVNQAPTINAAAGMSGNNQPVLLEPTMCVRRLMPIECERLQGFPDNWTNVPFRGRPAADGPRYRAIGNSMAVPVIRWLGERIDQNHNKIKTRS